MFQAETEDMLPRMAPKPSAAVPSGGSEGIIRPQVPEISILFGQQDGNMPQVAANSERYQQHNSNPQQQTYAAWKKQMLPKVNYPAPANMAPTPQLEQGQNNMVMHDYSSPRTNLYPFRSTNNTGLNMASNTNGFGGYSNHQQVTYRRSMDSCNNPMVYQHHQPSVSSQPSSNALNPIMTPSSNTNSRDVLTICAGTQTDPLMDSKNNHMQNLQSIPWSNLASQQDVDDVRQMLVEMKQEQQCILKMLETILLNPQQMKPQSRDVGVQADRLESDNPAFTNGGFAVNQESQAANQQTMPKNKFLQHLKPSANSMQTPKGKPMAQSTAYQPNSPQRYQQDPSPELLSQPTFQPSSNKPHLDLVKSASDTSLAMNELALKYLPNEKLAELLKELNMDCSPTNNTPPPFSAPDIPTTPVRGNVDKFEKGPSDISNASYKYLKKYRLLPEDHESLEGNNNNEEGQGACGNENQMPLYNSPQYNNNIRNTPNNQRQTPTNKCSPYAAGRLPLSPLVRPSPPQSGVTPQHLVNLENIKHQPKFL